MKKTSQLDQSRQEENSSETTSHLYKQTENVQELLDSLRDQYISYKESASRCHVELITNGSEDNLKYYYFPPKVTLLEEPEKQKAFRKKFIQEVGTVPEPEPLILLADILHQNLLETIGDRSNPSVTRNDLALFFKRRAAMLQHKKYKILHRWGNHVLTSEYIDKVGLQLDSCLGRLQKELDSSFSRADRLFQDDNYSNASTTSRPHPAAKEQDQSSKLLYVESPNISVNSAIRLDDMEVYLRIQTYRNKLIRIPSKLVCDLKWLPYSQPSRFDIWGDSRAQILDYKIRYNERKFKVFFEVAKRIKNKLELNGVTEEKIIQQVTDKYTKHLKGEEFVSRQEQLMGSHICNHEQPPIIVANNIELKMYLIDMGKEFGITGDIEIDNGHSFTYQVQVYYPTHFQKQVLKLQFDWYDTGSETDQETMEKLTKNLGLTKSQVVETMSRFSEVERKKSIIGNIKTDPNQSMTKSSFSKDNQTFEQKVKKQNLDFFSLDETDYKLKKADWLDQVHFEPAVTEFTKRQSLYLNSSAQQYDTLLLSALNFLDVNDAAAVNKILDEAAASHVKRAQKRNLLRSEDPRFANKNEEIDMNLKNTLQKNNGNSSVMSEQMRQAEIPMIEPMPGHIIKAYYTLRLLKTRDNKIKLLHVLNYFRSVQKRLALDIAEFYTREKAIGDIEFIGPQFGTDQNGNPRSFQNGVNGPGNIFAVSLQRKLDDPYVDQQKSHPISIKSLKYNQKFNPSISSTCPCMPKFHSTFGKPRLYEQVSEQIENKTLNINPSKEAKKSIGKQDRVDIDELNMDIIIYDEYGIKVIYEEAMNDMLEIEEELLKAGTFFINQHEFVSNNEIKEPSNAIDRSEMTMQLIDKEFQYQYHKVLLIQQFMECYEHTCDPLEQVRLIQIVCDIMAQRPRLNLEATYFMDSYQNEIEVLKHKREFFKEIVEFQINQEENLNEEVRKFQELKFRKIQDHIYQAWQYNENSQKQEKMGSAEEEAKKAPVTENLKNRLEQKGIVDPDKRQKLKEIAQRHITEYANNQYQDFSDVLGLPEVTAEELFNKQGEKEPLIVDCLREHAHFSKVQEGYPWYYSLTNQRKQFFGQNCHKTGIFDFYDSLCCVTKINATLIQSFEDFVKVHNPENGLALSCLERSMLVEARGKLRLLRSIDADSDYMASKCKNKIEEDFYLSNSDKMVFLMKEFKAHLHPDNLIIKANPLLVSKLDIESMSKFDFPRIKISDLDNIDELSNEQIVSKMIDLAKNTVTGETQEEKLIGGNLHIEDFLEKKPDAAKPEVVKSPSMMIMACNIIEITRLREELIQKIHETDILSIAYKEQLKLVNKDSFKLILADPLAFDTTQIMKENMNMIDFNDGSKLEFDLPFREFDSTLKSSLDFKSESCVKALMTNLGVEELRAILHYQIMQQQLLQVAVMMNQQLIDGSQKGLCELEYLTKKRAFTVPNSVININQMLSKGLDGYNMDMFNKEKAKLKQILQRESGDYIYSIATKKQKQRAFISKRYQNVFQKVITMTSKAEVKLRLLRSYRIKLLHSYCKDVLHEVYQDSLKIQLLQTCSDLRSKSQLLPKDSKLFHLGQGEILETISFSVLQESNFHKNSQKYNIGLILNNRFDTMFYVPSSDEIMQVQNSMDEKDFQQNSIASFTEMVSESTVDQQVKELVKLPIRKCGYKIEEGQKYHFRKIQFNEAYSYNTSAFKVLQYMTLIYRIYQLEYIMGRNNSPGLDILELEDNILNGRNYWADKKDVFLLLENDDQDNMSASEKVINKIITQKKAKIDLAEDLKQIAERLHSINSWSKRYTIENLKIETMIDLLNLRHQQGFSHFLYGLESLLETYFDKKNEETFNKMRQIKSTFIKRDRGFKMYSNGFSLNQSCINPLHMELKSSTYNDNEDFMKSYQSIIDEECLMPPHTEILRRNYGNNSFIDHRNQEVLLASYIKNYSNLDNCFFNVNDQERQYATTNFYQVDEAYKEYLQMMKGISDEQQSDQETVLLAKIEMLNLKNESSHLQNILLTWNANGALPTDLNEYEKIFKTFKDQMLMKTLQEREVLNEQQNKQRVANEIKKQTEYGIRVSKDIIQETLGYNVKEQHFNIKINERKAVISVFKKELDIRMIKQGIQMIKNEHSSLQAAFEHVATEKELHAFVHPQQQFASTLYQQVDRNSHLDIINKLSFVQSFLTRLRNRCTEVETLTSGPGIVFSMKDFNECLQIFCRGLLKYGEQELRTRVETQFLKEYQYQHMIYMKEQQCLYYRRKCEQFLTDIDKLINAKLSQKGNQIIYELDVANRELRMLKDNFYLMERLLRQEIKTEYEKTIQEKENTIQKFKQSFSVYKSELNNEIKEEVAKEIMSLDKKVKLIVDKRDSSMNVTLRGVTQQLGNKLNQLRQNTLAMSGDQIMMQPQMGQKTGNYYKVESMREILSLHKFIRQYKVLTQMKEVLTQEKHERELHNQRQQLTSNACLWEQLAEAEKREQIMRQELYYTQQNLAQYEKLIEKLQTQLENLQNQKLRLQQYKNSKSKRIEELESKMREVEIIENIDLNKVLEELRQRDKKLHSLQAMDRNIQQKIDIVHKVNQKKVTVIEKKLSKEKDLKEQAFGKLESLRLEMRALEGKDYTSELWKDKCKELFEICKDLQKENDSLKVTMTHQGNQIQGQLQIIQNQNNQRSSGNNPFSPFSTSKDKQGFSLHSLDQTTKPSTAAAKFSQQSRLMSRGGGAGPQSHHGHILHTNALNEQTLVSGLSLPEIGQQDTGDGTIETRGEMMKTAFQTQSNFTVAKQKEKVVSLAPSGGGKIGSDIMGFTSAGSTHGDLRNIMNGGNRTNQGMFGFSNENAANLMTMTSELQPGIFKQNQFALSQPSMSQLSKSQSRMTANNITGSAQNPSNYYQQQTMVQQQQQTKFKQKAKRLKTTHAQRALNESEFIQNNAVRKAGMGIQSRQQQQSMTAAGFEGLQMIKGTGGIFGGSQSGKKNGLSEQLLGQTTQMHLNINLNQ